jgi:hypothetical protein
MPLTGKTKTMTALTLACLVAAPAWAESMGSIATSMGLLGVWAQDCSKLAAGQNWYSTVTMSPDGKVGGTAVSESRMQRFEFEDVRVLSPTTVAIRMRLVEAQQMPVIEGVFATVWEVKGDFRRVLESVAPDGRVIVKDAIDRTTMRPVSLYERCGPKPSTSSPPSLKAAGRARVWHLFSLGAPSAS